jgi:hypothetical protein
MQALQPPAAPETNAEATPPAAPAQAPAVSAPANPPPAEPVSESVSAPETSGSAGDNAAQASARAALLQNMPAVTTTTTNLAAARVTDAESPGVAQVTATPSVPASVNGAAQIVRPAAVVQPSIPVPAPPITAEQATRLQELDAKYSANQISPEDYFIQREAILKGQ